MRVAFFWEEEGLSLDRANPYGGLLAKALAPHGVELVPGFPDFFEGTWLEENRERIDVLHLHWPHFLYAASDAAARSSRCADFLSALARARNIGYRIVWTVHNLYPHESPDPGLDRVARLALVQMADALIVHCNRARDLVGEHFYRRAAVHVIPHGHFRAPYPNEISRQAARARLGLPAAGFVYLFFGNIRPNKGVEQVLDAFDRIDDPDAVLLLGAKVYSRYGEEIVARARAGEPRVQVRCSGFFENGDFQLYFNAANAVVLPFLDILTSGSAITALSFERPVVAPAIGCLPELVQPDMGVLYEPARPDALRQAMLAVRTYDEAATSAAIRRKLLELEWEEIASRTLTVYKGAGDV